MDAELNQCSTLTQTQSARRGGRTFTDAGLDLTIDNQIFGKDIFAYRIQWFSGSWSIWYIPEVNDLEPQFPGSRFWRYFDDHTHRYVFWP